MAITNGFDTTRVLAALKRHGWNNEASLTDDYSVTITDTTSDSGRYYNDGGFHASLTLSNIYHSQDDKSITSDEFNTYIGTLEDTAILKALSLVYNDSQHVESGLIFRKLQNYAYNYFNPSSKFLGLRIISNEKYAQRIDTVQIMLNEAQDFSFYLFNDLIGEVTTYSVTGVEANKQKIVTIDRVLNNADESAKGGTWFLGLFTEDLGTAKIIDYGVCKNKYNTYGVTSIESTATGSTFDMQSYSCSSNMYLNASISSFRDLTEKIVLNAHLLDNLTGMIMAWMVIEMVQYSQRSNNKERNGKEMLQYLDKELNLEYSAQTNPFTTGIKGQIRKEVKSVKELASPTPKARIV